jgi:hypothetical protein
MTEGGMASTSTTADALTLHVLFGSKLCVHMLRYVTSLPYMNHY